MLKIYTTIPTRFLGLKNGKVLRSQQGTVATWEVLTFLMNAVKNFIIMERNIITFSIKNLLSQ